MEKGYWRQRLIDILRGDDLGNIRLVLGYEELDNEMLDVARDSIQRINRFCNKDYSVEEFIKYNSRTPITSHLYSSLEKFCFTSVIGLKYFIVNKNDLLNYIGEYGYCCIDGKVEFLKNNSLYMTVYPLEVARHKFKCDDSFYPEIISIPDVHNIISICEFFSGNSCDILISRNLFTVQKGIKGLWRRAIY